MKGLQQLKNQPLILKEVESGFIRFEGVNNSMTLMYANQLVKKKTFREFYDLLRPSLGNHDLHRLSEQHEVFSLLTSIADKFRRYSNQKHIFPYWEYKYWSDLDNCVNHKSLDGIVLSAEDPKWNKIFPLNKLGCFCDVAPRFRHEVDPKQLTRSSKIADTVIGSREFHEDMDELHSLLSLPKFE